MNERDEVIIPISRLFYNDAGPHVVSAGGSAAPVPSRMFTPARGQELHDLLNASISQLGGVSGAKRRKTPSMPLLVPIETLLYSGRAALERALEIRSEIRASATAPLPDAVNELLDLVALAALE